MDNSSTMRYAIYARYSSDLQRQSSSEDQIRKCNEYGHTQGWLPAKDCIYIDEAISGVSTQRAGLQRMLAALLATVTGGAIPIAYFYDATGKSWSGG